MGRMLKFDSPTKLSKLKKSMTSPEKISSIRDWRRQKNRNSVEMELLTGLPVPTVPPYPIEYFEDNDNGMSHVNMAFRFSEESIPPAVNRDDRYNNFSTDFTSLRNERESTDNDSKGSSSEDSRDSVGGSTVDSGVVLSSRNLSRRTSGDSQDFRTSPDGRAERDYFQERLPLPPPPPSNYPLRHRIPPPPYPSNSLRPPIRGNIGPSHPISNGTLKRNNDHINRLKNKHFIPHGTMNNYQDFRGRAPAPVHRPPMRMSSMPPMTKEHIYVNRPPVPSRPHVNDDAPPPYPGGSKFETFPPPLPPPPIHHKPDPPQPLPHLGSQIRSQLWQTSAAPRPCGRSKSVHDTFRSRLGSINTLGIPYNQATLPSRLQKKNPPIFTSNYNQHVMNAPKPIHASNNPDVVLTVPISKFKTVVVQPRSPFKKTLTPVYSKVIKTRKPKKQCSNSDSVSASLLTNQRGSTQSYSTITEKPNRTKFNNNNSNTVAPVIPTVSSSHNSNSNIERNSTSDNFPSPLYEELLELQDGEDETDNGQYSIEVRIDYSKGTKYKVERRRRRSQSESDKNNNTELDSNNKKTKSKLENNLRSDKLKQFRRDKKNSFCDRLLTSNDSTKSLNETIAEGKNKFWSTLCCCR